MFTAENQLFIRLILLLVRAGSGVFRKIIVNGLQRQRISVNHFLQANKSTITSAEQLSHEQLELLYPHSSDPPDILKWDISLMSYIILEFFTSRNSSEYKAVTRIREIRNDFKDQYPDDSIDIYTYSKVLCEVNNIFAGFSRSFVETDRTEINNLIKSAAEANLNLENIMNEVKLYNPSEDFAEQIQTRIENIAKTSHSYQQDVIKLQQAIIEIRKWMENNGQSTAVINTVFGQVRLTELDSNVDQAAAWLFHAIYGTLKGETAQSRLSDLKDKVDHYVQGIKRIGVKITDVKEGSMEFTFECSTLTILLDLIDYFNSSDIQTRHDEMGEALSDMLGQHATLTSVLLLEPLQDIVRNMYTRALHLQMTCTGIEDLQHVLDAFSGGAAMKALESVPSASDIGKQADVETSIDRGTMQHAISSSKQQLEISAVRQKEGIKSIEPYSVTLPVKVMTEPFVKLQPDHCEKVLLSVESVIKLWHQQNCMTDELKCFHINNVKLDSRKKVIRIHFDLKSDMDLEQFNDIARKPESEQYLNTISKQLTQFVEDQKIAISCELPGLTKLVLKVVLAETLFYKGKTHFSKYKEEEEEESTDSDSNSDDQYNVFEGGIKVEKTSGIQTHPLTAEENDPSSKAETEAFDNQDKCSVHDLSPEVISQSESEDIGCSSDNYTSLASSQTSSQLLIANECSEGSKEGLSKTQRTDGKHTSDIKTIIENEEISVKQEKTLLQEATSNAHEINDSELEIIATDQVDGVTGCEYVRSINNESAITDRTQDIAIPKSNIDPNLPNESIPTGRQETNTVKHTFFVSVPSNLSVTKMSLHLNGHNKKSSDMRPHSKNIHEVNVFLPVDISPDTSYNYEYCYNQSGMMGLRKPYAEKQSCMFPIGKSVVHRDSATAENLTGAKSDHLNDIIVCEECHKSFNEAQLCDQILSVCSLKSEISLDSIDFIRRTIKENFESKSFFLLAVIMAEMCNPGKELIVPKAIEIEHAEKILIALSERRIKSLPDKLQHAMPYICRLLTKKANEGRWCSLVYLQACYPFFDDKFVLNHVDETIRKGELLAPTDQDTRSVCKSLCEKLAERACDQNPENICRRALVLILENVPTETAIYVYNELRHVDVTEDEKYFQDILLDTAKKIVRKSIDSFSTKRELGNLITFAKLVCNSNCGRQTEFEEDFERAILQMLSFAEPKVGKDIGDDMKSLFETTECFKMPHQQEKLLITAVDSANEQINQLFINLIEVKEFKETYTKLSKVSFEKWFQHDTCNRRLNVFDSVVNLLNHFSQIYRIAEITKRDDVASDLKNLTIAKFKDFTTKEVLESAKTVEKLCATNKVVGSLFEHQVLESLRSNRPKPYDAFYHLCGSAKEFHIEQKFTLHLVSSVMEQLLARQENDTDFQFFIFLSGHVKSLKLIFNTKGQFKDLLLQNKTCQQIVQCVRDTKQKLISQEVSLKFVQLIDATENKENVRTLLQIIDDTDDEVNFSLQTYFQDVEKTSDSILKVLNILKKRKPHMPGLAFAEAKISSIRYKVLEGEIFAVDCRPENEANLWGIFTPLPQICKHLEQIIDSDVFWNLTMEAVDKHMDLIISSTESSNIEKDVRHLFGGDIKEDEKLDFSLDYLRLLHEKGIKLYQNGWIDLEQDNTLLMPKVFAMFKNAEVIKEIELATKVLLRPIESAVKGTLEKLWSLYEVSGSVETMKMVLQVFCPDVKGDDTFQQAAESFETLSPQNMSGFKFKDVQVKLETIYEQAKVLTEESLLIMEELGNSSHMIDFLRSIANDDIRTLIDAVEYISEQHVQESTVSALIEVKRFVYPFLDRQTIAQNGSKWLFQAINKQVGDLGNDAKTMASKILDCKNNIHNLKSLIGNAANRGEQTKEVISHIVKKGTFHFRLDRKRKNVCFETKYKHNKEKTTKSETTLIDIKSRALLLMNTERTSQKSSFNRHEFELFINSVDLCTDIKEILSQLFSSGHVKYTNVKIKKVVSMLGASKEELLKDFEDWSRDLQRERKHFYLLNFIHGRQIPILNHYLEGGEEEDTVLAILKFIHPKMRTDFLKRAYKADVTDNRKMLESIGKYLNLAHQDLKPFRREMNSDSDYILQITDKVHKGQVRVVRLESNSSFVIKTVLALYKCTSQNYPEPHQMLFCTRETRWSEIQLLLERCVGAETFYKHLPLFCIVNVEMLRREIQDRLVQAVDKITGESVLLAIVCQGSENLFRSKLSEQIETVRPLTDEEISKVLKIHCPNVKTYTSDVAGLGKTTSIYSSAITSGHSHKTLHISGTFNKGKAIDQLRNLKLKEFHFLHLDIGNVQNPNALDIFLFELIILKYITEDGVAFYLETENVYIEVSNTINDFLVNALPFATSFERVHLSLKDFSTFQPSAEIGSATQVVCHYLDRLENGDLDKTEIHFTGKHKVRPLQADKCRTLMKKYINLTGETSLNNIHIFLNVLSEQLKKLSASEFFRNAHIIDMVGKDSVPSIRSTLVNAMITVSLEFSSRSVQAIRSVQSTTRQTEVGNAEGTEGSLAEKSVQRVECMIRWEDSNHLMFVFHNQNIQALTPMYRDKSRVGEHVQKLFERQMNKSLINFGDMNQEDLQQMLQKIARKSITPLPGEHLDKLAKDYALTPDNLLKMVLIMMRLQARVPVILMGETGCGKTSLIRYLSQICGVAFKVLNIHAGVTLEAIVETIENENDSCCKELSVEKWLFLDEVNTSQHIGVISDAICHHRCNGILLAPNLVIMGACNPYKLRSEDAARTAGLDGKIKSDELSRLVYRVLPLPETMVDYVWDFGFLSEKDEGKYIQKMIEDVFAGKPDKQSLLKKLLAVSQSFVRDTENATFSVSLRDVYRCKTLVKWFMKTLPQKQNCTYSISQEKIEMQSIVLALAHCYHSRFSKKNDRHSYRQVLESVFVSLGHHQYKEDVIHSVIKEEQKDILGRMELPPGIARNTALQENVFMLLVCILNKIPIFLVGKPGCSKSLAMQVIRSNIRGKDSKDEFFKKLPQLYCVSFQGSESSTSDGISMVFEKAERYQESYVRDDVLSVVILDEIGLAEISGFNPLKVLHNLLEPDGQSQPNVAVVGISNWALDASKMNRAIHLSRPDMDLDELIETGIFISESFTKDIKPKRGLSDEACTTLSTDDIKEDLKYVAKSYSSYTKTLKFRNFHGLRDYYFLVKFITRTLAEKNSALSDTDRANVIMKGLQRNFGGLPEEEPILLHNFKECFSGKETDKMSTYDVVVRNQSSTYDLVVSNIKDSTARHLMIITKGESVLAIVEDILRDTKREKREIIFGSRFEDDLTDDYNYRILSRIIMCMEQGVVLILKDLEKIYGSLYDMLNQSYTRIGAKNNCRVALGPYSNPFCHVAESFRCIVLVDERKLDYTDPPFLNRFEKQFLTYGSIIDEEKKHCLKEVEQWLEEFSTIDGKSFTKEDMFPIYNEEMMVSLVVFNSKKSQAFKGKDIVSACQKELLWLLRPEAVIRLPNVVSSELKRQKEEIKEEYFALPLHDGIKELVKYQMKDLERSEKLSNMTIVFTNSNIHTSIKHFLSDWTAQFEKLQTFKSEKQLSFSIEQFWKDKTCEILFLQCSAVEDEQNIMLTKTIIERYGIESKERKETKTKKLVFLAIHLDGTDISTNTVSQINYLSGWKLIMMDTLESSAMSLRHLCSTNMLTIISEKRPLNDCLKKEMFWAFTKIRYGSYGRDHVSISNILERMKNDSDFLSMVEERICSEIRCNFKGEGNTNWQMKVACDVNALGTSANFVEALECFILNSIKYPLAKIIFKLESLGAVNSYFMEGDGRKRLWKYMFENESLFSISDIQNEFGPWCYSCERADLSLVMPFSRVIFENIEATREDFLDEIPRLRAKCDIDANEALPDDVTNELVHQQQNYIFKKIPDLQEYEYECMKADYVEDFCNLVSYTTCASLKPETRIHFIKRAITQNIDFCHEYSDVFARLHCTFWANASLFGSFMLLLESCVEVFQEKEVLQIFEETVEKNGSEIQAGSLTQNSTPDSDKSFQSRKRSAHYNPVKHLANSKEADSLENEDLTLNQSGMLVIGNESMLKDDSFHKFISLICSRVLPASTYLEIFGDARHWQLKARNVMTVAAEVSRQPKRLHALRFCDDVATHFLFPYKEPISKLETIGGLLVDKDLDSEIVFKAITNLKVPKREMKRTGIPSIIQKILSHYLIRCIASDPETTAYTYIFKQIIAGRITDECIGLFKAPLHVLLYLEFTVNKEAFYDIVKPGRHSSAEESEPLSPVKDLTSTFLIELDACLKETVKSKASCPFNVLIIDLLQQIYSEMEIDDISGLLLQCGTILQTGTGGLEFIAALSLLKVIIAKIGEMVSQNKIQNQTVLLTALNATYSGIIKKSISKSLMIYFLKIVAIGCPLNTVMKYHQSLTEKCASLSEIKWTHGYVQVCFDRNPLSLFVSDIKQNEYLFSTDSDESTMKKNMSELVKISKKGCKGLLFLFSIAMREIYLLRFFDTIHDSKHRKLGMICDYLKQNGHSEYTEKLLFCLMGKESFRLGPFVHGVKTPAKQYYMLLALISSYALVLANKEFMKKDRYGVLAICLMKPTHLKNYFIPGFPDTPMLYREPFIRCDRNVRSQFASCTNCSLRLAFDTDSDEHKCPMCKNELETGNVYRNTSTRSSPQRRKGFFQFRNFENEHFQVRNVSPVTCNVLYFLLKGNILGSFALGFSSMEELSKNQSDLKTWKEMRFWEEITIHWANIAKLLNLDDYQVAVFLHVIMHRASTEIFVMEYKSEIHSRNAWEKQFDDIVTGLVQERFSAITGHVQQCDELYGFSKQTVELQIREADDIASLSTDQQNELLPGLFRVSEKPSKSDFIFQLQPVQEQYPFLVLVLSHEHNLDLPQYIHNIIQWHLLTVVHTYFSLKSYECSKMSVQDFLEKIPGLNNRELAKKRFEAFKTTWGFLAKVSNKDPKFKDLHSINTQSSLSDCLILEEKSVVYEVLSILVKIQNNFIDRALSLCFDCDNLYFLSRDIGSKRVSIIKNLPITETRREHFLNMSFSWIETLMHESYSSLSYGQGRSVYYEFGSVEKELIAEMLVGKAYLNLSVLPKIVFTDQLYRKYASLVEEVCVSIKQEPLPNSIARSIRKDNEENKCMAKDLINYLDMVMTLLQKMKCDGQKPLIDFASERSNILGRPLPRSCLPSPDNSINLCHIVSLHELLEELCADPLIEGLDEKYCTLIDDQDIRDHFENMPKLSMKTAETVVGTLKRFVYRCMSMREAIDAEQLLIRYLSHKSFWPHGSYTDHGLQVEDKRQPIDTVIPTNVLVCHVQSIVFLLTERIEKITSGDAKIDKVIIDWKATHVKKEEDSKLVKRRKMLQFKKT